jgi:hypothetical protein
MTRSVIIKFIAAILMLIGLGIIDPLDFFPSVKRKIEEETSLPPELGDPGISLQRLSAFTDPESAYDAAAAGVSSLAAALAKLPSPVAPGDYVERGDLPARDIPSIFLDPGHPGELRSPWGGEVRMLAAEEGAWYVVLDSLPADPCRALSAKVSADETRWNPGGTAAEGEDSAAAGARLCGTSTAVAWKFQPSGMIAGP